MNKIDKENRQVNTKRLSLAKKSEGIKVFGQTSQVLIEKQSSTILNVQPVEKENNPFLSSCSRNSSFKSAVSNSMINAYNEKDDKLSISTPSEAANYTSSFAKKFLAE